MAKRYEEIHAIRALSREAAKIVNRRRVWRKVTRWVCGMAMGFTVLIGAAMFVMGDIPSGVIMLICLGGLGYLWGTR